MPRTLQLPHAPIITLRGWPADLPRPARGERITVEVCQHDMSKATVRTPMKNGKLDWSSVSTGDSVWVTAHSGALAGRHILVAKDPDGAGRILRGGGAEHWKADAERYRRIDMGGKRKANQADASALQERDRVEEANKPKQEAARQLAAESRKREQGLRDTYQQAAGIGAVTKEHLEQVRTTAYHHASMSGLSHDEATHFAGAVASSFRKAEKEKQAAVAERRGRELIAKRMVTGKGDELEPQPPADTNPLGAQVHTVTLPHAADLVGKSQTEIESVVANAFDRSREAADPTASQPAGDVPLVANHAAIVQPTAEPATATAPPQPPDEPFITNPAAYLPSQVVAASEPAARANPSVTLNIGTTIAPLQDADAMQAALGHYHALNQARHEEAAVRRTIEKAGRMGLAISPSSVAELRTSFGTLSPEEEAAVISQYTEPGRYSPDSFMQALGSEWSDSKGYGRTIGDYAASGAASALTGLLGKELGSRYDVGRIIDAAGSEAAAITLAHRLRRELSPPAFAELVDRVRTANAATLPATETLALDRHQQLMHEWSVIGEQVKQGQLNIPTLAELEAHDTPTLIRKLAAAADTSAVAVQNILARRANLGSALGSMEASATFLHALNEATSQKTRAVTIFVGDVDRAVVDKRMDALRLKDGKNALVSYDPNSGYNLHTTSDALQKLVGQTSRDRSNAERLDAIKNNTASLDDDPFHPSFFKPAFVNEQGETTPLHLFSEQRNDIRFCTQSQWPNGGAGGYITRSTGGGKTLTGLGIHAERLAADPQYVGLCAVPNKRTAQWQGEIERYTSLPHIVIPEDARLDEKRRIIQTIRPGTVVVMSHKDGSRLADELQQHLTSIGVGAEHTGMVIDEAQELKSQKSDKLSAGAKRLQAIPAHTRVAMTATPARDNVAEAYDAVAWIAGRQALGPRAGFARAYGGYGEGTNAQQDAVAEVLHRELLPYMSSGEETGRHYQTNFADTPLQRSDAQARGQAEIEAAAPTRIAESVSRQLAANPELDLASARRKANEEVIVQHLDNLHGAAHEDNAGVQALIQNIGSPGTNGKRKHLIYVSSPAQRRAVEQALQAAGHSKGSIRNIAAASTSGTMSQAQVEERKDAWKQHDDVNFLLFDKATQSGHNLAQADEVHMLGQAEDMAGHLQAIGRARRASRRVGHDLTVHSYGYTDSPFSFQHRLNMERQRAVQAAVAPQLLKGSRSFQTRIPGLLAQTDRHALAVAGVLTPLQQTLAAAGKMAIHLSPYLFAIAGAAQKRTEQAQAQLRFDSLLRGGAYAPEMGGGSDGLAKSIDISPMVKSNDFDTPGYTGIAPMSHNGQTDKTIRTKMMRRFKPVVDANLPHVEQGKTSIRAYQQNAYVSINDRLAGHRGNYTPPAHGGDATDEHIKNIDATLSHTRTPSHMSVYRDPSKTQAARIHEMQPGDIYHAPTYESTSARPPHGYEDGVQVEYRIPAGTHALYLDATHKKNHGEHEVLLHRGLSWKLVGKRHTGYDGIHATFELHHNPHNQVESGMAKSKELAVLLYQNLRKGFDPHEARARNGQWTSGADYEAAKDAVAKAQAEAATAAAAHQERLNEAVANKANGVVRTSWAEEESNPRPSYSQLRDAHSKAQAKLDLAQDNLNEHLYQVGGKVRANVTRRDDNGQPFTLQHEGDVVRATAGWGDPPGFVPPIRFMLGGWKVTPHGSNVELLDHQSPLPKQDQPPPPVKSKYLLNLSPDEETVVRGQIAATGHSNAKVVNIIDEAKDAASMLRAHYEGQKISRYTNYSITELHAQLKLGLTIPAELWTSLGFDYPEPIQKLRKMFDNNEARDEQGRFASNGGNHDRAFFRLNFPHARSAQGKSTEQAVAVWDKASAEKRAALMVTLKERLAANGTEPHTPHYDEDTAYVGYGTVRKGSDLNDEDTAPGEWQPHDPTTTHRFVSTCKRCNITTAHDYHTKVVEEKGFPELRYIRKNPAGEEVDRRDDDVCPICKASRPSMKITGVQSDKPCNSACARSTSHKCKCSCGGANHATSHRR